MSFYVNQKFLKLLFPRGLWYCKKNDRIQTSEVNVTFDLIHTLSGILVGVKKEELVKNNQFSALVSHMSELSSFLKEVVERITNDDFI